MAPSPQQAISPDSRTPHVCHAPALTERKRPAGASVSPLPSYPQHTASPDSRTPQLWRCPALTERKRPAGASV